MFTAPSMKTQNVVTLPSTRCTTASVTTQFTTTPVVIEDLEDKLSSSYSAILKHAIAKTQYVCCVRFALRLNSTSILKKIPQSRLKSFPLYFRDIPPARLYEESLKMLQSGHGLETYHLMREYNLCSNSCSQPFQSSLLKITHRKPSRCLDLVLDSTDHSH